MMSWYQRANKVVGAIINGVEVVVRVVAFVENQSNVLSPGDELAVSSYEFISETRKSGRIMLVAPIGAM